MTYSTQVTFSVTRFKPGYDIAQVDAFIAGVADRSVQELNDAVFKTTRLSPGYDMRQVDDYIDACVARKLQGQKTQ